MTCGRTCFRSGIFGRCREALVALRLASERGDPFTLVLTDYMPDMDGFDLTRESRVRRIWPRPW
jgi:hypothetical protein